MKNKCMLIVAILCGKLAHGQICLSEIKSSYHVFDACEYDFPLGDEEVVVIFTLGFNDTVVTSFNDKIIEKRRISTDLSTGTTDYWLVLTSIFDEGFKISYGEFELLPQIDYEFPFMYISIIKDAWHISYYNCPLIFY